MKNLPGSTQSHNFNMHSLPAGPAHIGHSSTRVAFARGRSIVVLPRAAKKAASAKPVDYGKDWYESTRNASKPFKTVKEELEYRREANRAANGGKERKDLYTDNWDGSEYKGSSFNVLTVIALVSVLTPLLGLVFAYTTFGVLWG